MAQHPVSSCPRRSLWIASALVCLLLAAATAATAAEPSGVLLYAGFEGTANATVAAGSPTAEGVKGAPQFAPGRRGEALLSGDAQGAVSYAVTDNLLADRGSIEFWVCPQDWNGLDKMFHVFFEAGDPGWLMIYKYYNRDESSHLSGLFLVSPDKKNWTYANADIKDFQPGQWHHVLCTWSSLDAVFYLDGKPAASTLMPRVPQGLTGRFIVGDQPMTIKRNASSLIDEFYVYDRPLTADEAKWTYEHAADRQPGQDVPLALRHALDVTVTPLPSRHELRVNVRASGLPAFTGTAQLDGASGAPAEVRLLAPRSGEATIPFSELPAGKHRVTVTLRDPAGQTLTGSTEFVSPGPSTWLGNKVGISTTPPPPWTSPVVTQTGPAGATINVWGRTYRLGPLGFPEAVTAAGQPLLAAPLRLAATVAGRPLTWSLEHLSPISKSAMEIRLGGSAKSEIGTLNWKCIVEFDGMARYDLELQPKPGANIDALELGVPLRPERSTLAYRFLATDTVYGQGIPGATPIGEGVVLKAGFTPYWWLGDEERGLCAFCESDEAWDRVDRPDAFQIRRTAQATEAVWSFISTPTALTRPWRFSFGLQATPIKEEKGWRAWRMLPTLGAGSRQQTEWPLRPENHNVLCQWTEPDYMPYFGYPAATDPATYRALVKDDHSRGIMIMPYALTTCLSSAAPIYAFYGKEWENGYADTISSDVMAYKAAVMGMSPAPSCIDFIVQATNRYVRDMDLDGLYHDFTMVLPSSNQLAGCGYVRDGKLRRTYPFFGTRELYKRVYTALKVYGAEKRKPTFMMGHNSTMPFAPIISFCDAFLDGEHFRSLGVKDNYLDLMPLAAIRAEFMGHNLGVMPFFLPEIEGQYATATEPTASLMGLMLLHDMQTWPLWLNRSVARDTYAVLDGFGINDAQFLPYWNNAAVIGGQSEAIKASAYRKPAGGALLCIVNTTRQPQTASLAVRWDKLKSGRPLAITDAFTGESLRATGSTLTAEVKPLQYRLLRVD